MEEGTYTYTSKEFHLLGTCPRKRAEGKGYDSAGLLAIDDRTLSHEENENKEK